MSGETNWQRVRKDRPCPICQRPDWCLLSSDKAAVICARVESSRRCGEAGWLHRIGPSRWRGSGVRTIMLVSREPSRHDLPALARNYQSAVNPERLIRLADNMGLSVESLRRLRIGWASESRAWAFPMIDCNGKVRGIRLRLPSGKKFSVVGGREGLFIPSDLSRGGRLCITEGPTDCAALLDLGFNAVGRPSCTGGMKLLVELVQAQGPDDLVIVADGDAPGQRGAESLASTLRVYCPAVRIITPPPGVKDARAWKQSGATAADIQQAIGAAQVRKLAVAIKSFSKGAKCKVMN